MEPKIIIDLSVKYGLDSSKLNKLMDVMYQVGVSDYESREFKRISDYICKMGLIEMAKEELIEELKRKGLV